MVDQRLRVGQVTSPFGVGGAVKVYSLTDFDDRWKPGSELWIGGTAYQVEWSRMRTPTLTLKLAGVDDREAAERLRGKYLEVPGESAPPPAEGWYHHQLIGLSVATESGRELGRLEEVLSRPANDIWVVRGPAGEVLVPAIRDAVASVDLEAGRVIVGDWLFDSEEA